MKIWVLGNGQLGNMLNHAGIPLDLQINLVDILLEESLPIAEDDIITVEREHWPQTVATKQLSQHDNFLNAKALTIFADRLKQKQLLDNIDLPHAPWLEFTKDTTRSTLHDALGDQVLLKHRSGGYDGKGQLRLEKSHDNQLTKDWHDKSIAEKIIDFDEEVSIIGARNKHGECVFYPITANLHYNGMLIASIAPLTHLNYLQDKAQTRLAKVMESLNYIGVMAMECFKVGDDLLINEIAPRVHNSGHWSQCGCCISQFELHLRAICDLPLVDVGIKTQTAMLNLLGVEFNPKWLAFAETQVYWYGKEVRPMRKLGHINLMINDQASFNSTLANYKKLLPDFYHEAIFWLENQLKLDSNK